MCRSPNRADRSALATPVRGVEYDTVKAKDQKSKKKGSGQNGSGQKEGAKKGRIVKIQRPTATASPAVIAGELEDQLGFGLVVTDAEGLVIEANETARRMIAVNHGAWPENATCCSLFGCGKQPLVGYCITRLAAASEFCLPEMRLDMPPEHPTGAIWVTAARAAPNSSRVLIHLRPAALRDRRRRTDLHWMGEAQLRIRALGPTTVEAEEATLEGDWLFQKPGELLKYLVCQRGRPAHVDEIVEALWPETGEKGRNTVRYFVHVLRERLEPARAPRSDSPFITSTTAGAYSLDRHVALDIDEFETLLFAGLEGSAKTAEERSQEISHLEQAIDLYRGDLFVEEPFAEWAFAERERLRSLAVRALKRLVEHHRTEGNLAAAATFLERNTDLEPLDTEAQRALIGIYIEQGRRGKAKRRYASFRKRLLEEFGEEPDFRLSDFVNGGSR